MKMLLKALAAAGLLAASGATGAEFSGNVTLTSDYSFRGVSQTLRDPAIQGGFDVAFDSGFSVGTWASTVNFGEPSETSMELDFYVGWSKELREGVSLDLTAIYFDYPNARDESNYQEYAASLSFGDLSFSVNYSPAYVGVDDLSLIYPAISYSKEVGEGVTVSAAIGYSELNMDPPEIAPVYEFVVVEYSSPDDYIDYSASIAWATAVGIDVSVGLVGTNNEDCGDDCEFRPVFSLSKSF